MRPSKSNKQKKRKINQQLKTNGRTPKQIARIKKKKSIKGVNNAVN